MLQINQQLIFYWTKQNLVANDRRHSLLAINTATGANFNQILTSLVYNFFFFNFILTVLSSVKHSIIPFILIWTKKRKKKTHCSEKRFCMWGSNSYLSWKCRWRTLRKRWRKLWELRRREKRDRRFCLELLYPF